MIEYEAEFADIANVKKESEKAEDKQSKGRTKDKKTNEGKRARV
jgi:hypothetical protein